ncbi:MAG: nitroreductase family deazaflavin-dependent oxidoreductase [Ktedonobacteraceae bacterium]
MSIDHQTTQPRQAGAVGRAMQRFFMQGHVSLYRLTGGAVGSGIANRSFLILTTRGRKSGIERDTPLQYFSDGDRFIVIASNGGAPRHPTWWLNLQANPQAKVQLKQKVIPVTAKQAEQEEHKRLWSIIEARHQNFVGYQKRTTREIPIIILTPNA